MSQSPFSVCVFCGAAPGRDPVWTQVAQETGAMLAAQGWTLVYGGGNTGLMGALADGALQAGGRVHGIMPEGLVQRERAHRGLSELEVVPDLALRKERMLTIADAFVALPGGLGTLDEVFEVLTWYQLDLHQKPSFLLNFEGFYSALLTLLQRQEEAGFLHKALPLSAVTSNAELISALGAVVEKSLHV